MCKQGAEPLVLSNSWVLCANKLLNLEKNLHVTSLYPEWISPSQFLDSYQWIGIQSRKKSKNTFLILAISLKRIVDSVQSIS